jgi:hypothetical protein
MRSLAIDKLFTLTSPIDKVVLAHKYGVSHWLLPAYHNICEREEWLSDEEGYRLGLGDVLKIGRARQAVRSADPATSSVTLIKKIFGCEGETIESIAALSASSQQDSPVTAVSDGNVDETRDSRTTSKDVQDQSTETFNSTTSRPVLTASLSAVQSGVLATISAEFREDLKSAMHRISEEKENTAKAQLARLVAARETAQKKTAHTRRAYEQSGSLPSRPKHQEVLESEAPVASKVQAVEGQLYLISTMREVAEQVQNDLSSLIFSIQSNSLANGARG